MVAIDGNFNNTPQNILFYAQSPAKILTLCKKAPQNVFQFKLSEILN